MPAWPHTLIAWGGSLRLVDGGMDLALSHTLGCPASRYQKRVSQECQRVQTSALADFDF